MINKYTCSDGSRVEQQTINRRRSEAYQKYDDGTKDCRGCGGQAYGHAHIISQTRCKELGQTELIWTPWNWFKACHLCNSAWESFKGETCKKLRNYAECLAILKEYDPPTYLKYCNL